MKTKKRTHNKPRTNLCKLTKQIYTPTHIYTRPQILPQFAELLHTAFNTTLTHITNNTITYTITNDDTQHDINENKLLNSQYVPASIVKSIQHTKSKLYNINVQFGNNITHAHIKLYLYGNNGNNGNNNNNNNNSNNNNSNNSNNNIEQLAHEIVFRLSVCTLFYHGANNNNIIPNIHHVPKCIYIYMLPDMKILTPGKSAFTPTNVNSAVTDGESITIFRAEEMLKSVFHELIHFYKFDGNYTLLQQYTPRLLHLFAISHKSEYKLNEAITETMACLLNAATVTYKYDNTNDTTAEFTSKFHNAIIAELKFSILNVAKILHAIGFNTWRTFCNNTTTNTNNTRHLIQYTSVFSYHIIKCMLLWDINTYLTQCINIDTNIGFKNDGNIGNENMMAIIEKIRTDKQFEIDVNQAIKGIGRHNTRSNSSNAKILKTFRMTCTQ